LSLNLSEGETREEIEGDPIITDELPIPEDTMVETKTSIEIEARGSYTPLLRGQTNLTPHLKVIMGVVACFKRKILYSYED
jgi:hypothetical protein